MAETLRIALAQTNTTVGDFKGNCRKIIEYINKAKNTGAEIVLFPELTIPSYFPEDLLLKKRFVQDNLKYLDGLAAKVRDIIAIVGFVDLDEKTGNTHNAAAILNQGKIAAVYHKICLPNYSVFDEKRYFVPGDRPMVFDCNGSKIGLNICEDIWVPDGVTECQAFAGDAEVILSLSASPYHKEKRKIRVEIGATRASFTRAIVVYLNLVGGQDGLIFDGNSFIVDHRGELICECAQFIEDFAVADLDLAAVRQFRKEDATYHYDKKAYKSLYQPELVSLSPHVRKKNLPDATATCKVPLSHLEEIYQALVLGTRDYVRKNGFAKVVIGLSGGIDSALTAAIAVEALGRENVIGILMPSDISSEGSVNDSLDLASNLNIETKTIPISQALDIYLTLLKGTFEDRPVDSTEENLQARIRGNILMALSNKFGWLVLTTGNKSETSVGYCTLYGDMAGGFAVIKDVWKTLVYELCNHINSFAQRDVIPRAIITKPPSAELRPDQTDQDSLPPYDLLDAILEQFVEKDKTVKEIIAEGYPREVVKRVARLVDINEYKRRQAPPGIKISRKAFGKDRRMPITNQYQT